MKKSIFFKIFIGHLFIIFLLSFLILTLSFRTVSNYYLNAVNARLQNLNLSLEEEIISFIKGNKPETLDVFIKGLGKKIKTRITVVNLQGEVLADSEENPKLMVNHRHRPEIIQALEENVGQAKRFSSTIKEEMLYVAMPLKQDGETIGILRTSLFLKDINNLLESLRTEILNVVLIAVVISMLAAIILSNVFSRPVKKLIEASRRVASGDFDARVFLKNKDDFKKLADSFNYMTDKIKSLFTDLSLQKEELDSIIASIEEGLLVIDPDGTIVLANESFNRICQVKDGKKRFYWEVLREPEFSDTIKKVIKDKINAVKQIEINGKIFLCSVSFVARQGKEIVIIFHDITDIKNLERIKKDFVVNVSHELRTPLTAIKGYIETLDEEIDEKHKHYLGIISKHTERLINIVQDLSVLSELEERNFSLQLEEINFKNLIEDILKLFGHKLKEKGLSLKLDLKENVPLFKGDAFRLEQMMINLIDNAIKYTEKGEITISLTEENGKLIMKIEDTGIGIPEAHLERIFERFYVVDKSRSRKLGGTGLGLSIVKHIVLLHNGRINVESIPGAGSQFKITFPL